MYLADVGVKCPHCGVKFKSKQLPVYVKSGRRNSELRQAFPGLRLSLEQYTVCTCPSCGKADWIKNFPAIKEPVVLDQPKLAPHLQFNNAALAATEDKRDFYKAGLFYLYAAWCADDSRAYHQACEYRLRAAEALSKSLLDASCPATNRAEIEYLIGELLRLAGDAAASRDYFRRVIAKLPANFAYMARKLMRLAEQGSTEPILFEAQVR